MKKTLLLLTVFILIAYPSSKACSCIYHGGFAFVHQMSDLVVYGRVIQYDSIGTYNAPDNPYSMKFEILKKFRGDEKQDTIIVLGDYGNYCRPYIKTFEPETEWLLALKKYSFGKENEYIVTICGEYFLPVKDSIAIGRVTSLDQNAEKKKFELTEIEKIINHPELYKIPKASEEFRSMAGNDYLPISNGNYWKMQYAEKRAIDGKTKIDGKEYYVMQDGEYKFFYRKEKNKVWVKEFDDPPGIKFDLNAKINDTWKYNDWNVTLISKTDTVFINKKFITNCYSFYLDIPEMVDDEHIIWLAPGIGFIKEECPEWAFPVKRLEKAKINGNEMVFIENETQ